jgi:hypothetical protein
MNAAYKTRTTTPELFAEADRRFDAMKTSLTTTTMTASTHTEVEDFIFKTGMSVLLALYQSHLTLRGQAEPVAMPQGADGTTRTHHRGGTSRPMTSLFGEVIVPRSQYEQRQVPSLHPVDAALNLPADKYSLPVRKRVALAGAVSSFDATVETLATTTGAKVPKRQVEELVRRSAVDFEAYYSDTEPAVDPGTTGDVLVLTTDGKGIVIRPLALREATRKTAENATPKLSTRTCPELTVHRDVLGPCSFQPSVERSAWIRDSAGLISAGMRSGLRSERSSSWAAGRRWRRRGGSRLVPGRPPGTRSG